MRPKHNLVRKTGRALKKAAPTILTCVSAVGVVATAMLTAKATPKALKCVKAAKETKNSETGENLTRMETIGACWQCYVPAAVTGIATIGCIFSVNVLNRRQQASLASAYALVNRQFRDYKGRVRELYGQEAHEKVMRALAVEKSTKPPISAEAMMGMTSLGFDGANEEERLFYDSFSERYFQATISQVLQAEYHLNRNFSLSGGFITLNEFYKMLGIKGIPEGDDLGWMVSDGLYWVDFDHTRALVDDGLNGEVECYIIDMPFAPMKEEGYDDYL